MDVRLPPQWEMLRRTLRALASVALFSLSLWAQNPSAGAPSAQPTSTTADAAAAAEAKLEKDVQNPVSELITLPLQNNTSFEYGPYDRTQNVLDIQPVIPINLNEHWMLKSRTILPVSWQPYANQNSGGEFGLGDTTQTFFLAPRGDRKLIWGIGPAIVIPTATNSGLGQGKFSVGPPCLRYRSQDTGRSARSSTMCGRRRLRQPSAGEPDAAAGVRHLPDEEGVVCRDFAYHRSELASRQRQRLACAGGRRHRKNY